MMKISKTLAGVLFIISGSLLWSFFPIFSKIVLEDIPFFFTIALCWSFAGLFYYIILRKKNIWEEWKRSKKKKELFYAALLNGLILHSFLFLATQYTTAGNIIILGMSEILFSFLFFHFVKKEKESIHSILGALFIFIGVFIIFSNQILHFSFNLGDVFAVIGLSIAPIGNSFQKDCIKENHSSSFILFIRCLLISPFLFFLAFLTGETLPTDFNSWKYSIFLLAFIGIGILGLSKIFWLEAIKRISVPIASALSSIEIFFTLTLSYFIISESPTIYQFSSLIPIAIGIYLLIFYKK